MKLAFISNHPAPYRNAFLDRLVRCKNVDVEIFSLFSMDKGHSFWDLKNPHYQHKVLVPTPRPPSWRIFLMLLKKFVFSKYDCVCWPGFLLWYLTIPMLIQACLGRPYVFSADTITQRKRSWALFQIKKFIVRRAKFIFVPGEASIQFFVETFGIPREKLCVGAYALDNKKIIKRIRDLRSSQKELRIKYGISPNDKVFLMVANMLPTRHYPITVQAFLDVALKMKNTRFIIVGSGPDLEKMQNLANKFPIINVFPGVSFDEMLGLYALSDVYVHGGTEPASTALIIGGIAKLPLLSSMAVGCSYDCLQHERSGFCVDDYLSVKSWRMGFSYMLENESRWSMMGEFARQLANTLDVDVIIDSFILHLMKR